ncbi:Uncharacterized conserved protein [Alloiococcus otitis]|uniref:Threonine/Serine exporter ThrE domain-containing protein n=1 Tax=Alloiococcus otitis ATCC 51267 TaxID=883081 RepID=K9E713_9LACT|nr:threonine/serine exporter family protein [Alloiococcus otitis]EKU92944.1 hypothetical protein HMPREF9698_01547 [Alloiococcus otitis ATCC 51267]SUU80455.1 Uncharacterized conserved protein [Alloiococcus otitis]
MYNNILTTMIAAGIASLGFAILYNVPRRVLLANAIIGAVGWAPYYLLINIFGSELFVGAGLASLVIALSSQLAARKYGLPVTVFSIPAIIPIVPGGSAYNAMRSFVTGEYFLATGYFIDTFIIAGAIALGLTVNTAIFQVLSPKSIIQQGRRYFS